MKTPVPVLIVTAVLLVSCSEPAPNDPLLDKAQSGDPAAQLELAEREFSSGNNEAALVWLNTSQQAGYAPAAKRLAIYEAESAKIGEPVPKAIATLESLAQSGDLEANLVLANCYERGIGTAADSVKALAYYEKAAELGNGYARYRVLLSNWIAKKEELSTEQIRAINTEARSIGMNDDPRALSLCARILDEAADINQADKLHLEAAKAGEPYSMYRIGVAYHRYVRDPAYGPLGFEYLSKAEQAGIHQALLPLAKAHHQGNGTPGNEDKARSVALLAAWHGDPEAVEFALKSYLLKDDLSIGEKIDFRALWLASTEEELEPTAKIIRAIGLKGPLFDLFAKKRTIEIHGMLDTYKRSRRTGRVAQITPENAIRPTDPFSPYGEYRDAAEKALIHGDPAAALLVASSLRSDSDTEHDPAESSIWIDHASRTGDANASLTLYELYKENPDTSGISPEQARDALRRAEIAAIPEAIMYVASEYKSGELLEPDNILALNAAERAIDAGHPEARAFIKRHLLQTADFQINSDHVLSVVEEIADEGNVDFQFLEAVYRIGLHINRVHSSRFDQRQGVVHGVWFDARKDYREIWRCYDQQLSMDGGLPEEVRQAAKDIFALADDGYTRAQEVVAMWYLVGLFADQDPDKALHYFNLCKERSEEQGIYIEFANALFTGEGLPTDIVESAKLFRQAAEMGNASARELFQDTGGAAPSAQQESVYPFTLVETAYKAGELADPEAMFYLAIHFRNATDLDKEYADSEYRRWLGEAAKRDEHKALVTISNNYLTGTDVEKNPQRALRYLKRSADLGNAESQYAYGQILALGIEIEADVIEGMNYLEQASKQGNAEATTLLQNLKATNSIRSDEDAPGENVLVQIASAVLGHDTFPIALHAQIDSGLFPIVGSRKQRPEIMAPDTTVLGERNMHPIMLAGDSFSDAYVTIESATLMAPFISTGDSFVFTGNDPGLEADFTSDKEIENLFALLILKQGTEVATYHWKQIGRVSPGKTKKVTFRYDDPYVHTDDIALYFFDQYTEVPSNIRFQPQFFLNEDLAEFSKKRKDYLEENKSSTLEASFSEAFKDQIGEVIYLPTNYSVTFSLNELGFVKSIEAPEGLREDALRQLYRKLPFLTFLPALADGNPIEGQTTQKLD